MCVSHIEQVVKENEAASNEKKKLQTETERLMHQVHCRDEIISVFTKTLETHDLLHKEPGMAEALAQLRQQVSSQFVAPIPAAGESR